MGNLTHHNTFHMQMLQSTLLGNHHTLAVQIKQSKTDPFWKAVQVIIGRTGGPLCPVAAILAYMVLRKSGKGPLFRFKDGRLLTRVRFVS